MHILKISLIVLLLSGCSVKEYREADNKVLCDPNTHEAYLVNDGLGATSFVRRSKNLDKLCKV